MPSNRVEHAHGVLDSQRRRAFARGSRGVLCVLASLSLRSCCRWLPVPWESLQLSVAILCQRLLRLSIHRSRLECITLTKVRSL